MVRALQVWVFAARLSSLIVISCEAVATCLPALLVVSYVQLPVSTISSAGGTEYSYRIQYMASEIESGEDRRVRTQQMVEKWLHERQEMLVLYCQLAGLEPYKPDKSNKQLLKDFCQVLVDYIAFGHFEVYERISRGEERRQEVRRVAEQVYPKVVAATDIAVAFNDKYEASENPQALDRLDADLSRLGDELASRIEAEDQVVKALLR